MVILYVLQMVTGVVVLHTAKTFGAITFPSPSVETFRKVCLFVWL